MKIRLFKTLPLQINGFIFLFSLLVFTALIKLGFWQLDRAEQKDLRLQKMALYQQQAAIDLKSIVNLVAAAEKGQAGSEGHNNEDYNDLPVSLSGTFNSKQSFLLDNQVYKGRLGYRVIKLFQDEKSNMSVLVNLGWIPGAIDRSYIPEVAAIKGRVAFKGKVRVLEPSIVLVDETLETNTWPQRIQSIDINKISKILDQPLLPFIVYIDNDEPLGYVKEWVPIVMSPEKHRGYAFQWFTLALAWLILMLMAAYKSAKKDKEQ